MTSIPSPPSYPIEKAAKCAKMMIRNAEKDEDLKPRYVVLLFVYAYAYLSPSSSSQPSNTSGHWELELRQYEERDPVWSVRLDGKTTEKKVDKAKKYLGPGTIVLK